MLNWPKEGTFAEDACPEWHSPGSNICLDFHGDPARADMVVFSDGNHHMALEETLIQFVAQSPDVSHIFYTTTPPAPNIRLLKHGTLQLGNLLLSVRPHLFISPADVLARLAGEGLLAEHRPFFRNQGNVLLIPRNNPKGITGFDDLFGDGVRIFISNPQTEGASYAAYEATLKGLARRRGLDGGIFSESSSTKMVYGKNIHHREAPQAVADGAADVAIVYYHLALRYTRIFPDTFDFIPLGGDRQHPQPLPENVISESSVGLIDGNHPGGLRLLDFLLSDTARTIYAHHGLLPPF